MAVVDPSDELRAGSAALAEGRWLDARACFDSVISAAPATSMVAIAAEGSSDAWWWLGDVSEALRTRRMAYEAWRQVPDDLAAARTALWLAREYLGGLGNDAAARGWLRRAETLAGDRPPAAITGWIELVRATIDGRRPPHGGTIDAVVALARESRDGDLEALALARKGLGLLIGGDLDGALGCFHEAMAIGTGGETSLQTLGYLCCDLALATELWGDPGPFAQWNDVVVRVAAEHGHPPLVAFCATCCAEVFTAGGDWSGAEAQLRAALSMLNDTGQHARCLPPTARLGELLILQGRLEEAEDLLRGDRSPHTSVVRGRLALARGNPAAAVVLLERARRQGGGDSLLTVDALTLLVDAHLAVSSPTEADAVAVSLERLAAATGNRRVAGRAALARGRVHIALGAGATAVESLEEALDHLGDVAPGAVELAEAHLALARLRMVDEPELAMSEARSAVAVFERAGATSKADEAAALARSLGDRSRVGPKRLGTLTRREQEVLRLLAQGLTNAEVAERLFISPKTVENHVSSILSKLNVRTRTEAAAYALANPR
jgi:DNA-binding NarL/FixJ family response regulator/tetratricopeptide (TPR) repeat protein